MTTLCELLVDHPEELDQDLNILIGLIYFYMNQNVDYSSEKNLDEAKISLLLYNHIKLRLSMIKMLETLFGIV